MGYYCFSVIEYWEFLRRFFLPTSICIFVLLLVENVYYHMFFLNQLLYKYE